MRRGTWWLGFALVVAGVAGESVAEAQNKLLVTFAKRECPQYTDITANKARNNIQESLEDLGVDSPYLSPPYEGQPVNPTVEDQFQPNCTPVTGFAFTMGEGIAGHEVDFLSVVRDPYPTQIVTQASVPLLDGNGNPTGDTIAGAVTIELTDEQAQRAQQSSRLWTQEGLPSDPLMEHMFPGRYGFGALRCAVDNLNGDNVEFISYPANTTHVFCYSYNVVPPPAAAILRVTKAIEVEQTGLDEAFRYCGPGDTPGAVSPSYNSDGCFLLAVRDNQPATIEFVRAAGLLYEFFEEVPDNWAAFSGVANPGTVECTSANGTSVGTIDVTTDPRKPTVTGTLGDGDTVHCTFTNRLEPIPEIVVRKRSIPKVGEFDFEIDTPSGGTDMRSVTTVTPGIAEEVGVWQGKGTYVIREFPPASLPDGEWLPPLIECNGVDQVFSVDDQTGAWEISVDVHVDTICIFDDVFEPAGHLTIEKITENGVGETLFFVFSVSTDGTLELRFLIATTTEPGVPAVAVPVTPGDSLEGIGLTAFLVIEVGPYTPGGEWTYVGATCDVPFEDLGFGAVIGLLNPFTPDGTCTFTNRFELSPTPSPTPPGVTPTPSPTASPIPTPSPSPTATAGVTPTPIPLPTPSGTPIVPPTPSPSPSPTPDATPTPAPTASPSPTPTPTPSPAPQRKHPWGRKSGLIGDIPFRGEGVPSMRAPIQRR